MFLYLPFWSLAVGSVLFIGWLLIMLTRPLPIYAISLAADVLTYETSTDVLLVRYQNVLS
jgi:hypothetical protein